jgi:sulfur-carrier protein
MEIRMGVQIAEQVGEQTASVVGTVRLRVRYFAALREALGGEQSIEVPAGTTLAELRDRLRALSPLHDELLTPGRAVRCALDQVMAAPEAVPGDGAEVAFFPPVTGG